MRKQAHAVLLAVLLAGCAQQSLPQPDVTMRKPQGMIDLPVDDGGTGLVGPAGGAEVARWRCGGWGPTLSR